MNPNNEYKEVKEMAKDFDFKVWSNNFPTGMEALEPDSSSNFPARVNIRQAGNYVVLTREDIEEALRLIDEIKSR